MSYHSMNDAHANGATPEVRNDQPQTSAGDHTCMRCRGLMVLDHCFDVLGDAGEIDCRVLRCIQCGDVVDPVILRHRSSPPALKNKKHVKWSSAKLAAMGYR